MEATECTEEQADAAMLAATQERLDAATLIATIETPDRLRSELRLLTVWLQGGVGRNELRQIHARAGQLIEDLSHLPAPMRMAVAS